MRFIDSNHVHTININSIERTQSDDLHVTKLLKYVWHEKAAKRRVSNGEDEGAENSSL